MSGERKYSNIEAAELVDTRVYNLLFIYLTLMRTVLKYSKEY